MSCSSHPGRWFRPRTLNLPTWRTWLLLCVTVLPATLWVLSKTYGWLAVTAPVADARYVVVEGWAADGVVKQALAWAQEHDAKMIFTTGIPMDQGQLVSAYPTYAELCAATLIKLGAEPAKVKPAPALKVDTDRTRTMAAALKQVLDGLSIPAGEKKLNLFTAGAHAYRSHMHFQSVLGPDWQVGVISVSPPNYMTRGWWRYSEGVKSVIEELIAITGQSLGAP